MFWYCSKLTNSLNTTLTLLGKLHQHVYNVGPVEILQLPEIADDTTDPVVCKLNIRQQRSFIGVASPYACRAQFSTSTIVVRGNPYAKHASRTIYPAPRSGVVVPSPSALIQLSVEVLSTVFSMLPQGISP